MANRDDRQRFYVIMRNDMASLLQMGKASAQAAHAQKVACDWFAQGNRPSAADWQAWERQSSHGFGNTIVKGASLRRIEATLEALCAMGVPAGIVIDEEYPLVDGDVVHLINLPTCMWAFGDADELAPLLREIPLL